MEARYLIDSTILIDHLNDVKKATSWLDSLKPGEAAISVISRSEALAGAGDLFEQVQFWLSDYPCYGVEVEAADAAAGIRSEFKMKLPDAFQIALARQHDLTLVSRDTKDFWKIPGLAFKAPYHL